MKARSILVAIAIVGTWSWAPTAAAHCDTLDGPVVAAAQRALTSGQVEHALIWVQRADERAVRDAYGKALAARAAGGDAAERADHAFYATLVRVHRKGEGAPYTGLKPAGQIEPPVAAADRALAAGQPAEVEKIIIERTQAGLRHRFDKVMRTHEFKPTDVEAGRAHVAAYVDYVHFVERVHDATGAEAHAHGAGHGVGHQEAPTKPAARPATPARHAH